MGGISRRDGKAVTGRMGTIPPENTHARCQVLCPPFLPRGCSVSESSLKSPPGIIFQTQPETRAPTPTREPSRHSCFTLQWALHWGQTLGPDFLGPFLVTWVSQGKSLNLYITWFLYLQNGDNKNSHLVGKWRRLNQRICVDVHLD